jgi:hypothetical protein
LQALLLGLVDSGYGNAARALFRLFLEDSQLVLRSRYGASGILTVVLALFKYAAAMGDEAKANDLFRKASRIIAVAASDQVRIRRASEICAFGLAWFYCCQNRPGDARK